MKVAILGLGTVGQGVYEMLSAAPGFEVGKVLVRPGKEDAPYKTSDLDAILSDPSTDAVAEVMGGVEPAFSYLSAAIKAGKHAVTSNKALVAAKGIELQALADENGVGFLFSAACGGAVPFLHNLSLAVESDEILSLGGILNGTTNYMLDMMQSTGMDYAAALLDAQNLGYAEKDPTADVSGLDALRKIMLACAVAYGSLPAEGLLNEGIESITAADVKDLQSRGLTCRLVVSGGPNKDGSVYAYVEPVLFPSSAPECSVKKNFNMAKYLGKNSGSIVMMGQGAGRYPTASAVMRDLSDLKRGCRAMLPAGARTVTADNSQCEHKYYVRTDSDSADLFSGLCDGYESAASGTVIITHPLSVAEMHSIAKEIRATGRSIFFACLTNP